MSTKDCVLCGKPVEDCTIHEIKLTICCKECCENESVRDGSKKCSTIRAMSEFGCRERDLERLHGVHVRDPYFRRISRVQFYLLAEVRHLGQVARSLKKQRAKLKDVRNEDEFLIERQKLEIEHNVIIHEIRPILCSFVLGDYLLSSKSKTLLHDVKQCYSVKDRACELMDSCKAHPLSAMTFCIDHPNGTPETYLELKENMRKVFSIEGNRIMKKLSSADKDRLKRTVLEDVLIWSQISPKRMILFKKLKEKVGVLTAGKIIHYQACKQRIERGGEETQVAEKLLTFWKSRNNIEQRRLELNNALKAHSVKLLKTKTTLYYNYINGLIDVDLDEIVGALDIESRLKSICQSNWEKYFPFCQAEFHRCFIANQLSLDESVDIAMKKTQKRIRKH